MTGSEPHPGLVERMKRHHEEAERRREEAEIESAVEAAGFDLGADIAADVARPPASERRRAGYDVDADLGVEDQE